MTVENEIKIFADKRLRHIAACAQISGNIFPVEILNEYRNYVTHLARAILEKDHEKINSELLKARGHGDRIHLDCAKLAYLKLSETIDEMVEEIKAKSGIHPHTILNEVSKIRDERKKLGEKETLEGIGDIADGCMLLIGRLRDIEKAILSDYMNNNRIVYNRSYKIKIILKYFVAFLLGVISSLVANKLYHVL